MHECINKAYFEANAADSNKIINAEINSKLVANATELTNEISL